MTALMIINKSTLVSDDDVRHMTRGVAKQIRHHAAPLWSKMPIPVMFSSTVTDAAPGTWVIAILDDPDQAGVLGWHTEDQGDLVYGRVFARPALDNNVTVSSVLSHEALEALCLAPETRVLTRDLNWVPCGDLVEGELLIGFDEENPGQGQKRRYQLSVVESVARHLQPCYEMTMEDGEVITSSANHRWLVNNGGRSHWVRTQDLFSAEPKPDARGRVRAMGAYASRIVKPLDTWKEPSTYVDGYLAGAYDGEGCISQHKSHKTGEIATRLSLGQNENAMVDSLRLHLKEFGVTWTEHRKVRAGVVHHVLYVSHKRDVLRLLGQTRPQRLLDRFQPDALGRMLSSKSRASRVMAIQQVGEREVVALQTSTRTFFAEGFASHNCDPAVNGWAQSGDGTLYATEIGDPVEADSYLIDLAGSTNQVAVSNFVLPAWFDPQAAATDQFDYLGNVHAPFTMTPGGYVVTMSQGKVSQAYGEHYEDWRRATKTDTSRTARRMPAPVAP